MVAYSFRQRFAPNIQAGLGIPVAGRPKPKRQTIREYGRRHHAVPGQEIQLYTGMRTKQCALIGEAMCVDASPIMLRFLPHGIGDLVDSEVIGILERKDHLNLFAQHDGFIDWKELRMFFASNHPGISRFEGVLIRWEPLTSSATESAR